MERTAQVCDLVGCASWWQLKIPSLFSSGKIEPVTYSTVYTLENAMEGLAALERRETWGKVVVRVRDETVAKL